MNSAIEDLITHVLDREGGYVDNPADPGGPTNLGITQGTLEEWRGHPVSASDVRALTQAEARAIYRARYFRGLEGVTDPKLLEFLFDYAVNSGSGRAVKCLMTVLAGRKLADIADQASLLWPAICERFDNYMRIMGANHALVEFSTGWANRMVPFWRSEMHVVADSHPSLLPAEADGILVRGEKGDAVKRLQEKLGLVADGDFGPVTERAVIAWQAAHGLFPDGVAGPRTLGLMGLA